MSPLASSDNELASLLAQGYPDQFMDWTVPMVLPAYVADPPAKVGTWIVNHSTSTAQNDNISNSTNAQNDSISFDKSLAAGTYNVAILGVKAATCAIVTVSVDGVDQGTIDMYNASTVINSTGVISGVSIPTSGVHRIAITGKTRNVANTTGWTIQLSTITWRRTDLVPVLGAGVFQLQPSRMRGNQGRNYAFVAGPIQNAGPANYFQPIVVSNHEPANIDSVVTTGTTAGTITINYASIGALAVVTFQVVPDETFVINEIDAGASVGLASAVVRTSKNGVAVDPQTLDTTTYPNSNFWCWGVFAVN